MNTKVLSKVRKRYTVKVLDGKFWVLDNLEKNVAKYEDAWQFVASWVYDNRGIVSGVSYEKRILKRLRVAAYNKALRLSNV